MQSRKEIIEWFYVGRDPRYYKDYAPTLRSERIGLLVMEDIRIRKLTPKECFRLMAFSDEDYERCKAVGMSNSQLYKQAGNSIVVSVLEAIFGQMIEGKENEYKERWG